MLSALSEYKLFNQLTDDKILDWSKFKQIADDILKCFKMENKYHNRVENIVRKRETACYKQFLLISLFSRAARYIFLVCQNAVLCG